jgi:branched-chain amino acid transport system permease protein
MAQVILFLQQLLNGLSLGSIYALIALGYTMVYGVLRFINFAHGDVYMLGAYTGFAITNLIYMFIPLDQFNAISRHSFVPIFVCTAIVMLGAMIFCAILGVTIERIAYRPLRDRPRLTVLITAIGVSLFLQNITQFLVGAQPQAFKQLIPVRAIEGLGDLTVLSSQAAIIISTIVLMVFLRLIVMKTKLGLAMRALSVNPTACSLMGVNNGLVISFTFALGSALAAAAGILVAMDSPSINPLMGNLPGIKAFVAAVLGGIGNITGAVVGGLIIGVLETLVVGYSNELANWFPFLHYLFPNGLSQLRDAIAFAVLIIILLFKPTGIFGRVEREKV